MGVKELKRDESYSISTGSNPDRAQSRVGESVEQTLYTVEQQRRATALRLGSLANAAHHAAGDLEDQFPQTARYMHHSAAGLEHLSSILRDPSLDELASLIGDLARKQRVAILAGVVLIGVGLSWLLKTSVGAADNAASDDPAGRVRGCTYDS
jgi:hypothetical protein